jgi:hypothetical protein
MDVNGYIFYISFWDALSELSDEDLGKMTRAMSEYVFEGIIPELNGMLKGYFSLIKPQLDANIERAKNAKKGGRPKKETNGYEKEKPMVSENKNQRIEKIKTQKENKKENKNKKEIENIYSSPAASDTLSETEKVFEDLWSMYPNKRGKSGVKKASKEEIAKIGLEEMTRAVERYVAEWEENKSWQQMKNGNTFFNSGYKDYLDANYVPKPEAPKKAETRANRFCNFPQREWNFDEIERLETERRDKERMSG